MRSGSGCWGWQWLTWSVLIAPCARVATSTALSSKIQQKVAKKESKLLRTEMAGSENTSNFENNVGIDGF